MVSLGSVPKYCSPLSLQRIKCVNGILGQTHAAVHCQWFLVKVLCCHKPWWPLQWLKDWDICTPTTNCDSTLWLGPQKGSTAWRKWIHGTETLQYLDQIIFPSFEHHFLKSHFHQPSVICIKRKILGIWCSFKMNFVFFPFLCLIPTDLFCNYFAWYLSLIFQVCWFPFSFYTFLGYLSIVKM